MCLGNILVIMKSDLGNRRARENRRQLCDRDFEIVEGLENSGLFVVSTNPAGIV